MSRGREPTSAAEMYKSSLRDASFRPQCLPVGYPERGWDGRFLPRYSGAVCDRIGCDDPIERRGGRFCAIHRAEHGRRLLSQLEAIRAQHIAKHPEWAAADSQDGEARRARREEETHPWT
jgi:hypothetical protein